MDSVDPQRAVKLRLMASFRYQIKTYFLDYKYNQRLKWIITYLWIFLSLSFCESIKIFEIGKGHL